MQVVVICFQISIFEPLETTEYMLQTNYQLVTHIGTFIKYYKISQLIHTQSIAN